LRHRRPEYAALCLLAVMLAGACGDQEVPAAQLGQQLFSATSVSTSRFNRFSCATCHVKQAEAGLIAPQRWDSGYNLHGVTARRGWWGGGEVRLLDAVNVCVEQFMGGRPLTADQPAARQLGAYLAEGAPVEDQPQAPLTIVRTITALDGLVGDPGRGALMYAVSCARCHGAVSTGQGSLDPTIARIPDDTKRFFPDNARAAFVEKIRHGRFFGIGGVMPFYSLEAMSDAEVADLLAYVGL
jgi:thiosulfate dehydrogenase